MTTYRVHYPLITRDAYRDFTDKAEANRFFYAMRNRTSPHLSMHSWRHVRMVALYEGRDEINQRIAELEEERMETLSDAGRYGAYCEFTQERCAKISDEIARLKGLLGDVTIHPVGTGA